VGFPPIATAPKIEQRSKSGDNNAIARDNNGIQGHDNNGNNIVNGVNNGINGPVQVSKERSLTEGDKNVVLNRINAVRTQYGLKSTRVNFGIFLTSDMQKWAQQCREFLIASGFTCDHTSYLPGEFKGVGINRDPDDTTSVAIYVGIDMK